ncbi:MAG: DUF6263 family protein [Candidatus Omnitrophica bacterium]|nr:DUF6263 family protein [Candidatus Omnitrophota bacterium]
MCRKITVSLILLFSSFYFFSFAETVVLKSGKTIEGKIIEKTDKSIKVDIEGISLTYYLDNIESIDGKKIATASVENTDSKKAVIAPGNELALVNSEGNKIKLRFNAKKGESYQYRIAMEQKISQAIMEQEQYIDQTLTIGFKISIEDVDKQGNATARFTYNEIYLKQSGSMGTIKYDSKEPGTPVSPEASSFAALDGASFIAVMDSMGRVVEIKGEDALIEHMLKKLPLPRGIAKAEMEKRLREKYNARALKETIGKMIAPYPENAVGVGDSWTVTTTMSQGISAVAKNTYIVKSRKDGVMTVAINSSIEPNAAAADSSGISREIGGVQEGTMELAEATGQPIRAKMTQRLSGQINVPAAAQMPTGASLPFSSESIITLDVTKQ